MEDKTIAISWAIVTIIGIIFAAVINAPTVPTIVMGGFAWSLGILIGSLWNIVTKNKQ